MQSWTTIGVRVAVIVIGLGIWFLTQALLGKRAQTPTSTGSISDGFHDLTAGWNRWLLEHTAQANMLLIVSSLVIDLLGLYLLGSAIFGATFQPFVGLMMLFSLRQICQAFCPLPLPKGMIWRKPGFPTILVTYGTSNDLFFSGHTAIAVFGVMCLVSAFGPVGVVLGMAVAVFEMVAVLLLRAHYTLDVFTGVIAALYVHHLSEKVSPTVDQWLVHIASWL